jgi:hypothetical protein
MSVHLQNRSVVIDGRPTLLFSGEIQNYRLPPGQWLDRLEKLKAMGLNCVGTYIGWNFHCPSRDTVDFQSPECDVGRFLDLAAHAGLYVIARPGPYVCNEWDLGGYPGWLLDEDGGDWRTGDPKHLSWCRSWYEAVDEVIAPRQEGHEGSVVLYQVENEHFWGDRELLEGLAEQAEKDGIDVPLISNCGGSVYRAGCRRIADGADLYTDVYELWRWRGWADHLGRLLPPDHPLMVPEFRGSNMPLWGERAPDETSFPSDWPVTFARCLIGMGANLVNFFVAAGGITPVGFGSDHISTCYGEDAGVAPWGGLGRKFYIIRRLGEALGSVSEQLSAATPRNQEWNTDNPEVECFVRSGERGTFLFPLNLTSRPQTFAVTLPDGRRLPKEGGIAIGPRASQFLMADVDLGDGVTLSCCTAEVLRVWLEGDTVRLVVHGEEGTKGVAEFAAGGETARLSFGCTESVDVQRASAGGKKTELFAVSTALAERTWFVPQGDGIVPLFSNLDLARHGKDADGSVRAESAPGSTVRITSAVEEILVDGAAAERSQRRDGLSDFRLALDPPAEVRFSLDEPEGRVESDDWTTEDASPDDGWIDVDPFGESRDVLTDTGNYQYWTTFNVENEDNLPKTLEFPGLSSAETVVYLNGVKVGVFPKKRPNGYHLLESLSPRFDVEGVVRPGKNVLAVSFSVVGRHNNGRPIYAGFTRPPVLYRDRDEEPLPVWFESPVDLRRWSEDELDSVPDEVRADPVPADWRETDLSRSGAAEKVDTSSWGNVRWYRARVRIPGRMRGKRMLLECPKSDQMWVYADGRRVGMAYTDQSKCFDLSAFSGGEEVSIAIALRCSWKWMFSLTSPPRLVAVDRILDSGWWRRDGFEGDRNGWRSRDDGWSPLAGLPAGRFAWFRQKIRIDRPDGLWAPVYVELDEGWRTHATIHWNGRAIGQYAAAGPDRRFYVADDWISEDNALAIAVDGYGADAILGSVRMGTYEVRVPLRMQIR